MAKSMENKILLVGKNGEYRVAKKNKEGNKLVPSSEKVYAREIVPYGFDFTFGGFDGRNYGIYGYGLMHYQKEIEEGKIKEEKDYEIVNLDKTINGLEKDVEEAGADYVLIDNLHSREGNTSWEISGRAQLFMKR